MSSYLPIGSRHPCEGDLAYLCPEYGCARKGGFRRDQRKIPELARELTDRGFPVDQTVDVCFWYKADIVECSTNVRFRGKAKPPRNAYDPERTYHRMPEPSLLAWLQPTLAWSFGRGGNATTRIHFARWRHSGHMAAGRSCTAAREDPASRRFEFTRRDRSGGPGLGCRFSQAAF